MRHGEFAALPLRGFACLDCRAGSALTKRWGTWGRSAL